MGGKSQPRRQLEPPCTPGDEPQERKSGAKATSGCAAALPYPDPGLTCVQVLQEGPKGHGVDLQAETAGRQGQRQPLNTNSLLTLCPPHPREGRTRGCLRTTTLLPFHLVSSMCAK